MDVTEALRERLDRFPEERYPVQHATARFHLGVALLDAGRVDEATAALHEAVRLFDAERLPVEHGKAANALGAAHRLAGRLDQAAAAFGRAALAFQASGQALEQGAAAFNLGLVARERGELERAAEAFSLARELLDAERAPAQAGAAAREHGAALLERGAVEPAAAALREAVALAERAADRVGYGAAANALGLAELAAGRVEEAVETLQAAAAAHPRNVRPAEHAMAKANLALAWERAGNHPRARISARQAAVTPGAPPPVLDQARQLLERLGAQPGDVVRVVADEPAQRRPGILREEVSAWSELPGDERRREAGAWIEGQLADERGDELAALLVGALLELPSDACELIVRDVVEAAPDGDDGERFRSQVARAMARFHVPQWMRLRDLFNQAAADAGREGEWG